MDNSSDQHIEDSFLNIRLELGIPSEVLARVARVAKIVELSSGDEELIYVAWENALVTFEMAVRLRLEEITGRSSRDLTLKKVIERCAKLGLFEENPWRVDLFRNFRNDFAHTKIDYKLGGGMRELIFKVVDNINDLYEDPAQRGERRKRLNEINALLKKLISDGAAIEVDGKAYPIFKAEVGYQRKRDGRRIYYIFCWPTFDLTLDEMGATREGKPLAFPTERIEKLDSEIACDNINSTPTRVVIRKIADPVESDKVRKWKEDLRSRDTPLRGIIEYDWSVMVNSRTRNNEVL